jgi:hypothetical protein
MSDSPSEHIVLITGKFPLGRLTATPGVLAAIPNEEIQTALSRHSNGDWGLLDAEDLKANDRALIEGTRLLSAYESTDHTRFWIITEWDRSVTTILLPEEY